MYAGPIPRPVVPILSDVCSLAASRSLWYGMIRCALWLTRSLPVTLTPACRSCSISLMSATGSITTPFPITQVMFSWNIPEGIRWRMYCLSPMQTVWPALAPPW